MKGIDLLAKIEKEVSKAVVGWKSVFELLTVALLSEGHVLIVGHPGIAKTTIAKAFAKAIGLDFKRIQLTPDLMPADILGCKIYNLKTTDFILKKGPIFANVILADEINRATPKTQSALLEAMQEGFATIEGESYELPQPFLVIATMNPIEHEGVYPLPEAQVDRFMISIKMEYPTKEEEIEMLRRKDRDEFYDVNTVVTKEEINEAIERAKKVKTSDEILEYIYEIVSRTRNREEFLYGASPRASEHLLKASKSLAFLRGRDYVIPDDVKKLVVPVLSHRLKLKAEFEVNGYSVDIVLENILEEVEVPK